MTPHINTYKTVEFELSMIPTVNKETQIPITMITAKGLTIFECFKRLGPLLLSSLSTLNTLNIPRDKSLPHWSEEWNVKMSTKIAAIAVVCGCPAKWDSPMRRSEICWFHLEKVVIDPHRPVQNYEVYLNFNISFLRMATTSAAYVRFVYSVFVHIYFPLFTRVSPKNINRFVTDQR